MRAVLRGACVCSAVAAALLAAEGSSAHAASNRICRPSTSVPAVASAAQVGRADVSITQSVGGNGMPQCTFAAHGHGLSVTINVDNGPQADWRLMRTVVEASQIFGVPPPGWKPPIGLNGLGPYASWFPELNALMAATRVDLLTVTVDWRRASRPTMIALARRMIVPFLRG